MCYGVRSAAEAYFGKELEMLTLAECASLISITNNPSLFDPYGEEFMYQGQLMTGMERNRSRQELVLEQMLEQGWITQEEFEEAWNQELVLKNGISLEDTLATCPNESCGYQNIVGTLVQEEDKYYCPECGTEILVDKDSSEKVYSWFVDTVLEDVAKALAEQDGVAWNDNTQKLYMQKIQRGGYNIYATIDMDVQNQIDAIYKDLTQIPDTRSGQQLQSAIVIIDNSTGNIVGMAGGVGDNKGFDDFNRATDAKLQSGSSIKPLSIYAPAFELGTISPATVIKDLPLNYDSGAWPLNDNRRYEYARTIYRGVVSSVNAIAANTLDMIGTSYSYQFAKDKFHLSSLVDSYTDSSGTVHSDNAFAPLAMGAQTFGVKVRDMATAFATFANNGVYRKGRTFTKVYDSNGNLVLDNTQETEQILSEKTVNYMNYCMLKGTQQGTGTEADLSWRYGISTAGKTGTTADNKDRWYCGFTGYYTAAVWTGFDSPEVIYGATDPDGYWINNTASYLFKQVMGPLHEGKEDMSLYDASKMVSVSVCTYSGKLATDACRNDIRNGLNGESFSCVQSALVYPEDIPSGYCDKHTEVEYCSGGGVATEYCHLFAEQDASIKFKESALVKMTQEELDEIAKAKSYNLLDIYEQDEFVYLVNENGSDGVFRGIYGNLKQDVDAPYMVCPVHTKEAWEKYQGEHQDDSTEPTQPGDTTEPADLFPWLGW
jgi:penicillin-binding protein 1A